MENILYFAVTFAAGAIGLLALTAVVYLVKKMRGKGDK